MSPRQISNITFDKITGEVLETERNDKIYKGMVGFFECQRDYIMDCIQEGTTKNIEQAKFDVSFYNFMLNSDEPRKRIDQYNQKKMELKTTSKVEIAKALGWEILL